MRFAFYTKHFASRLAVVALVAAAASGCVRQSTYDKDMADLKATMAADQKTAADNLAAEQKKCADDKAALDAAAKQAADAAAAAAAKAAEESAGLKKNLDECRAQGGDKGKALAACQKEREETAGKLARVQSSIDKVRSALQAMQAAGKLQVKVQRGFLTIALAGDILFDTGKAKLKEEASPVLRELAAILKGMPDRLFQVAGHTDNQGDEDKNWSLSMDRALTVVRFLNKEGVPGQSLSSGGYASFQPIEDNATPEGRQKNRRVEFLLMPNLSELLNMGK